VIHFIQFIPERKFLSKTGGKKGDCEQKTNLKLERKKKKEKRTSEQALSTDNNIKLIVPRSP
jgi:hypothetical protein